MSIEFKFSIHALSEHPSLRSPLWTALARQPMLAAGGKAPMPVFKSRPAAQEQQASDTSARAGPQARRAGPALGTSKLKKKKRQQGDSGSFGDTP